MSLKKLRQYVSDQERPSCHCPCRRLVVNIFLRAIRDAMETAITESHIQLEARAWLRSRKRGKFSAIWYAEMADLEWLLEQCKKVERGQEHSERILFCRNRSWN